MTTLSLKVVRQKTGWTITHTTTALITEVVKVDDPSDIRNILADAGQMASGDVLWQAHACGFDAVVRSAVTGWPLTVED